MHSVGVLTRLPSDIVKETLERPSVFKDEGPLSLEFIPPRLPHRDEKLGFLTQLFRFAVEKPGSISQRVLITGDVGTGKTVLARRFGLDILRVAKSRKVNLYYIHVNCRESKGSSFLVMKRVVSQLTPEFPKRGFAFEELLEDVLNILDSENAYLILAIDELESLIRMEGAAPIYSLTRIQEDRMGKPLRLSLICILREPECLEELDASTLDTLQRNFVQLDRYKGDQLETILKDRVGLAFKENAFPDETLKFIADIAGTTGDARYAIELVWRAGKYADNEMTKKVTLEHVRKAVGSVYPTLRGEYITALSAHEKLLLLALARVLEQSGEPYVSIGEVEREYHAVCEEYREKPREHTQVWKYAQSLALIGLITTQKSGAGVRGKTTLMGLALIPAATMRERLGAALESLRKGRARTTF